MSYDIINYDPNTTKISEAFHITEERARELIGLVNQKLEAALGGEHSHKPGEECNCPQVTTNAFIETANEHAANIQEVCYLMFKCGSAVEHAGEEEGRQKLAISVINLGAPDSGLSEVLKRFFK